MGAAKIIHGKGATGKYHEEQKPSNSNWVRVEMPGRPSVLVTVSSQVLTPSGVDRIANILAQNIETLQQLLTANNGTSFHAVLNLAHGLVRFDGMPLEGDEMSSLGKFVRELEAYA